MLRKIVVIGISITFLFFIAFSVYLHTKKEVITSDLKGMAEKKLGTILGADVSIGKINFGLLKYVALSGLKIDRTFSRRFFYFVDIQKIIVNYNILSLLKRNLSDPNKISLEAPTIEFSKLEFPRSLFGVKFFHNRSSFAFEVKKGKIRYPVPNTNTTFLINNINGIIKPFDEETLHLDFVGYIERVLKGKIAAIGNYQKKTGDFSLDVTLDDVRAISDDIIPIDKLNGHVTVENNTIVVHAVDFSIKHFPFNVQGTIKDYSDNPYYDLTFKLKKRSIDAMFRVFGAEGDLHVEGEIKVAHYRYKFISDVIPQAGGFLLQNGIVNDVYLSQGKFLFDEGVFILSFKRDNQLVKMQFMQGQEAIVLDLVLNHVSFLGYDLVAVGKLELEPDLAFWKDEEVLMHARLSTDYLIFNYIPLEDFGGTFLLSPRSIEKLNCTWGQGFTLKGDLELEGASDINLELLINKVNLKDIQSLGGFLLSDNVAGDVYGKITLVGPIRSPQIEGYLSADQGRFKDFTFSKVFMEFQGDSSVLTLKDSKIHRGNSVFYIKGDIDFTKENIFHNLVLESGEKLILWRGWDLSKGLSDDTVMLRRNISENLNLNMEGSLNSGTGNEMSREESIIGVEYNVRDDQSISFSVEESDADEMLSLKHKIKF